MKKKYTWKPDKLDFRDHVYAKKAGPLPKKVDLRKIYAKVYNQGQLGSCTANSISMAFDFNRIGEGQKPITPSRLFIYYNERAMEGTISQDAGAEIRNGIKSVAKTGVCSEKIWPYAVRKYKTKPPTKAFNDATNNTLKEYLRLDNTKLAVLKSCLAEGFGFVFGFAVYESFESDVVAKTGMMPMPKKTEKNFGGHAVFCVGYDDSKQRFIVRNSWGPSWGDGGHFYMPYAYVTNNSLCDDFWTLRRV